VFTFDNPRDGDLWFGQPKHPIEIFQGKGLYVFDEL